MRNTTIFLAAALLSLMACGGNETISSTESVRNSEVSFDGRFFEHAAIGGESTGYGLRTPNGSVIEVDLATNHLEDTFAVDKEVHIVGTIKNVAGIEIRNRKVLVATSVAGKAIAANGTIIKEMLDGCGYMIRLDDNTLLEATIPASLRIESLRVAVTYRLISNRASICMRGAPADIVSIKAIH